MLAKAPGQANMILNVPPPSRASPLPQRFGLHWRWSNWLRIIVGPGLLAKAVCQAMMILNLPPLSRASPLPQRFGCR
ncbi:hypothetical protein CXF97_01040 [Pseudomonas sp. Choline-02u-1]|nr:hypothetical protein CXF97_01040 [Pseudomonas sp. Choline-02u-1]